MTVAVLHVGYAVAATFFLSRAAARLAASAPDDAVAAALPLALVVASVAGSVAAFVAGRTAWSPTRALLLDVATFAGAAWWIAVVTLGPWTRDLGGVTVVLVAVARLAPGALAVVGAGRSTEQTEVRGPDRSDAGPPVGGLAPAALAFIVALGVYAALAIWLPAASLPLGDQIHYLLVADRLREGSLDATIDERLFSSLLGIPPGPDDAATHVADTPLGPRPIQGYTLPLLLLPGWAIAGRLGAHLTMALVAAWTSYQLFLILRDLLPERRRLGGWTWLLASFLPPLPLLATHLYPNAVGAALIATAYRYGFTAPVRRPALAASLLAATLFLTPRDGLALLVLLPFLVGVVTLGRARGGGAAQAVTGGLAAAWARERTRVALAAGAVALVAVAANAVLYGVAVPYAGYAFGTAQAQELTREPSITPRIWVGLPAILFDRTFGLAGSAPWVFVGLLGLVPALRAERARLVGGPAAAAAHAEAAHTDAARPVLIPAALAVGASVLALSFFRLWEGGYAPPNRYFSDVIPLWAPFVAYGLAAAFGRATSVATPGPAAAPDAGVAARWAVQLIAGIALFSSALATVVLNAIPTTALNTAFDHRLRDAFGRILGLDPLGWLPSFQPTTPDWYVGAYLRLLPALAIAGGLYWYGGARARRDQRGGPRRSAGGPKSPPDLDAGPTRAATPVASGMWSFIAANVVALALVAVAVLQPWLGARPDPVPDSLFRKWLPLSLAIAAGGSAILARALLPMGRGAFLRRHFALYLVPLVLTLVAHAQGGDVLDGQLGAIYLLIAVIFVANAVPALWRAIDAPAGPPRPGATPLTDRSAALHLAAVALVAFLVLLPYHRAVMPTASDEPHYLLIVQSLLYDGDVDLRNDYEGDRYAAFYPSRLPDMHGVEVGRAVYPIRDLGLPVLSLVPFAVAGRLGVLALMCVVGAALAAQLYLLLRDLRFAPRVAFLAVATTALTHPILTYTTQVYPELLTALVFVSAARILRRGGATRPRDLAIASALVALLPWLSTRAWPIAMGLGLVIAYATLRPLWNGRRGRDRATERDRGSGDGMRSAQAAARVAAGAAPFVAIVVALAFANWLMFGLFLPSAGYFLIREQQQVLAYAPHVGLAGLLFDRVFGLVPRAPLYLLAFLGAAALVRRARSGHGAEISALALGALLSIAYIANIAYWWADGSPPSRYLLGSLPLLVAAVAAGWDVVLGAARSARAVTRWPVVLAAVAVVLASATVTYVYAVLPNIRYDLALDIRATASPGALFTFLERATGLALSGLFPSLVLIDPVSVVLVLAWSALGVALLILGQRSGSLERPLRSG